MLLVCTRSGDGNPDEWTLRVAGRAAKNCSSFDKLMMRIVCQAIFRTVDALDRAVTIGVPHSWVTSL